MADGQEDLDFKSLDFSGIRFPSDRLTIGMLRHLYPDLFDLGFETGSDAQPKFFLEASENSRLEDGIGSMLFCERLIAVFAYAEAKGSPGPRNWDDVEKSRDELVDYYREFQLATGIAHASQLIRDIERQGRQLAKPKGR